MYSYVHRYHAGSFADIHKHLTLIALLLHFKKKNTPFGVLDSHAGEGLYDLQGKESQKNAEFENGLSKLLKATHIPQLAKNLLEIIHFYNPQPEQNIYPGSGAIIAYLLREQDRGILIEHHPQAIIHLKENFAHDKKIHVHDRDAYEALNALLPLKEKRGLVFIDPSYEVKTEYKQLVDTLKTAHARFPTGTYAIWYPILAAAYHQNMLHKLSRAALGKVWIGEWIPMKGQEAQGMYGSGMAIINPPFEVDKLLIKTFQSLNQDSFPEGRFMHKWLDSSHTENRTHTPILKQGTKLSPFKK